MTVDPKAMADIRSALTVAGDGTARALLEETGSHVLAFGVAVAAAQRILDDMPAHERKSVERWLVIWRDKLQEPG